MISEGSFVDGRSRTDNSMYVGDEIDLLYVLKPAGWSVCVLYVEGRHYSMWITHVWNDPTAVLINATVALLKGAFEAEFTWRDEPGETRWQFRRDREQHHKILISLTQVPDETPVVSFEIKLSQFAILVYHQMAKLEMLLREPSFQKERAASSLMLSFGS